MQSKLTKQTQQLYHNINSFEPGKIIINQQTFQSAIIITEGIPVIDWNITNWEDLNLANLAKLIPDNNLLIIGTGINHKHINANTMAKHQLLIESMCSKAACQTYTILSQEGRAVTAAIMI